MPSGPIYASFDDFGVYGLPPPMTRGVESADVLKIIEGKSRIADGYMGKLGVLIPLKTWGSDLSQSVCQLAAIDVLKVLIGVNPSDPSNSSFIEQAMLAMTWLRDVSAGRVVPTNLTLLAPDGTPTLGGPEMASDPDRGWGRFGMW